MTVTYYEWPLYIPNGHKICQHLTLQDPPKFTQIPIFGLKNMPSGNPALKRRRKQKTNLNSNQLFTANYR
jgi:hypothetical protein